MSVATLPNATLLDTYQSMTPGSAKLSKAAQAVLPSGLAHDSRNFDPYPIYVDHAQGPLKWDVDGNRYVDYFGGHGALMLGHNHPTVTAAVRTALEQGTHFGACHAQEVRWAELICQMVPSAECVRFTSSGTEATLMALRLARAYTGRAKLLRFRGHFHGWHDHMTNGYSSHYDGSPTTGVLAGIADSVLLCDPNDTEQLTRIFEQHRDIAAAILEPTGAGFGKMPLKPEFIQTLRDLTKDAGTILIFDEVVTGFRCSPGGAQQAMGITPDMTTMAKIVAGGLPGGAVAGRRDILDLLDFKRTKASAYGAALRQGMNEVLEEEDVKWAVYGSYSGFHIFTNPEHADISPSTFDAAAFIPTMLRTKKGDPLPTALRMGMLINGVDVNTGSAGVISAVHGEEEMTMTVEAFRSTVRALKREGTVQ